MTTERYHNPLASVADGASLGKPERRPICLVPLPTGMPTGVTGVAIRWCGIPPTPCSPAALESWPSEHSKQPVTI